VEQCFSLTAKQPQPVYKPKKQPAEQGRWTKFISVPTSIAEPNSTIVMADKKRAIK
jgi:hypothetical protein